MEIQKILAQLEAKHPGEKEFLQENFLIAGV